MDGSPGAGAGFSPGLAALGWGWGSFRSGGAAGQACCPPSDDGTLEPQVL